MKLAGEYFYGQPRTGVGAVQDHKVFYSDMTFDATINPVAAENGEAVFIDTEYDTRNMDPVALEKAFGDWNCISFNGNNIGTTNLYQYAV